MIKPSFLVTVEDGNPVVDVISLDADEVLQAYKATKKEAYVFIRPGFEKRKRAESVPVAAATKKAAKKAGRYK